MKTNFLLNSLMSGTHDWGSTPDNGPTMDRQRTDNGPMTLRHFAVVLCLLMLTLGVGNAWGVTLTYEYESDYNDMWSGDMEDASSFWKITGTATFSVPISVQPTSNITITINMAYFGNGTEDLERVSATGTESSSNWTLGETASPTEHTGKTYQDEVYTITKPGSPTTLAGLDITIAKKAGKALRIASITVSYTGAATYNVYLMSGCTGGSYSSNKGTYGSGTGGYSSCTKYSGITAGTSVTITAAATSGYQFDGWEDSGYSIIFDDSYNEITPSSSTSTTATFTMPSSDVVIWQCNFSESCANSVTISKGTETNCTFTLSKSGAQASCSGVTTTISITPTTGYGTPVVTQSGASSAPTPGGSGNTQTLTYAANTTGTSTINVSCSANTYTITLNKDLTPTTAGTASITATYNANTNLTSAITKPTKTGWTFGGYFTGKNGTGTQIIDASGNVIASVSGYTDASRNWKYAGNITLYAKWTCTVTWSVNGLTNVYSTQTVTYNSSGSKVASIPGPPSPASYCGDKFVGWSAKSAGSESKTTSYYDDLFTTVGGSPDIKSIGDITFYAVFADYDD